MIFVRFAIAGSCNLAIAAMADTSRLVTAPVSRIAKAKLRIAPR